MTKKLKTKHPLYSVWSAMKQRCYDETCEKYSNYGARGITICNEWLNDFWQFVADMGERPVGYTIERKENNTGYCKENCIWADNITQANNKRTNKMIEFNGKNQSLRKWATELNANYRMLQKRILDGWTVEKALTEPFVDIRNMIEFNGKTQSITDWSKETGIKRRTLHQRLAYGWSIERALTT